MRTFPISATAFAFLILLQLAPLCAQENGAFRIGYIHRIRLETWDNTIGLSQSAARGTSYLRNRLSLVGVYAPLPALAVTAQVTNENRYYFVPENQGFQSDEIFVDLLNVRWDCVAGLPASLVVGRQNIMLGEGFVVMDGGPLDGSRSIYFNAARADWDFPAAGRLTLLYVYDPVKDVLLPIIHNQEKMMVEQPERGIVLHYATRIAENTFQAYFIHKSITPTGDRPGSAQINSPGIRFILPAGEAFSVTGEAAYQYGAWNGAGMRAYGGYLYGRYATGWSGAAPSSVTIGGILLSGDDESTPDYEGWDPLFSRWPKWSESYIYAQAPERAPAYWTNLCSLYGRITFDFTSDIGFSFDYHHLTAPRKATARRSFPGGLGAMRGHLFIAKLSYQIRKNLAGHVLYEGFRPGDFYFDGASGYGWGRLEVLLTI